MRGMPTRVCGACLGMGAFVIAVVAGISSGNGAEDVLLRGLAAMVVCSLAGQVLGAIAERAVDEHLKRYKAAAEAKSRDASAGSGSDAGERVTKGAA